MTHGNYQNDQCNGCGEPAYEKFAKRSGGDVLRPGQPWRISIGRQIDATVAPPTMTADIVPMPVWKRGATREENFYELAHMARDNPRRFAAVVVIYMERHEDSSVEVREFIDGTLSAPEAAGMCMLTAKNILEGKTT